jgi:hypothetical protein
MIDYKEIYNNFIAKHKGHNIIQIPSLYRRSFVWTCVDCEDSIEISVDDLTY